MKNTNSAIQNDNSLKATQDYKNNQYSFSKQKTRQLN
ncbi:hypothetical protein SPPR111872_20965 [Sphingobacterium prati]